MSLRFAYFQAEPFLETCRVSAMFVFLNGLVSVVFAKNTAHFSIRVKVKKKTPQRMFFLFPSEVHEGKGPFLSDLLPSQAQKNDV